MVTTYFDVIKDKKTLTIKREIIVIAMVEQNACVYFCPISLYIYGENSIPKTLFLADHVIVNCYFRSNYYAF